MRRQGCRGQCAPPVCHDLLQLRLASVLVLIVLLEEEDEQGHADADQDHAQLRKDVAIIFQQLFAMAHVVAHAVSDAKIDDQRQDQQPGADQDEAADEEVAMARAEIHSSAPKPQAAQTNAILLKYLWVATCRVSARISRISNAKTRRCRVRSGAGGGPPGLRQQVQRSAVACRLGLLLIRCECLGDTGNEVFDITCMFERDPGLRKLQWRIIRRYPLDLRHNALSFLQVAELRVAPRQPCQSPGGLRGDLGHADKRGLVISS